MVIVILSNINKTGFFSKLMCCVKQVTFFCMKCLIKRRPLFEKDILEKRCAVVKSYYWHMEKILLVEKIVMTHNTKYYVKSLKRNKVKSSDNGGLWKKKK